MPPPDRQWLLVGCTGMLFDAALHVAGRAGVEATAIARDPGRLERLRLAVERRGGALRSVSLDWRDADALREALDETLAPGRPPLVGALCWIHSNAPEAPGLVVETLRQSAARLRRARQSGGGPTEAQKIEPQKIEPQNFEAQNFDVRCFAVLGSAAADPRRAGAGGAFGRAAPEQSVTNRAATEGVALRRIILGFVREGERSRWLTNEEICASVIDAIDADRPETVAGVVEPWEWRP